MFPVNTSNFTFETNHGVITTGVDLVIDDELVVVVVVAVEGAFVEDLGIVTGLLHFAGALAQDLQVLVPSIIRHKVQ